MIYTTNTALDTNTPIEEVAEVTQALIKEGKIKAWGMSEAGLSSIQKAHQICPLSALQSEYSLLNFQFNFV
ncbi:hypothetical protein BD0136_07230 [Helicobacter pylori]